MTTVHDIEKKLFDWAPRDLAMDWDNVGHLVGRPEKEVHSVLIALDITPEVVSEAVERGADLIVAHHPLINCKWHALQQVREDDRQGWIIAQLLRHDISAICMHTNLDAAVGGVNDALAEKLGLQDIQVLTEEKIGRFGVLNGQLPLVDFVHSVIKLLGCNGARYKDCGKPVHRVAVGGGACGDYISRAIELRCDTFVTSDLRYNDFLDTRELNLIDAGHFPTENVVCPVVMDFLKTEFPALTVTLSAAHGSEVVQYCM